MRQGDAEAAGIRSGRRWRRSVRPARASTAAVFQGSPDDGNKQDMRGSSLRSSGRCRLHLEVLRYGEMTGSTPAAAALDSAPAQAARRTVAFRRRPTQGRGVTRLNRGARLGVSRSDAEAWRRRTPVESRQGQCEPLAGPRWASRGPERAEAGVRVGRVEAVWAKLRCGL
jgi:hypothetical protein